MTQKPTPPPAVVTPIDRTRTSVVAPNAGFKVELETVRVGTVRGITMSFEPFEELDADVLPFAPKEKPAK